MPSIFYEIFNNIIKLDTKTIKKFKSSINELYKELLERNDIDNLKVLRNRLENLINDKKSKIDKKNKKEFKDLIHLLEKIEDSIEEETNIKKEKNKILDVVERVEKKYKKCSDIKPEKKDKYIQVCAKIETINYEKELIQLQLELLKLQKHIKEKWEKLLIIFEWRDAAWKWGTIKRFREYLNPRWAKVVALEKPTDLEKTQWYFQRYIKYLPAWWEIAFFDRSWYNRWGVEPVMGFVSKEKYEQFHKDVPHFEKMLVDSGIKLVKFYFSVSKSEQAKRFESRKSDPLKQYKLSPIDQYSQQLWEKYSLAEYRNFKATHNEETPWTLIKSDDKKKARINAIKFVLKQFDYPNKIDKKFLKLDDNIVYDWKEKCKRLKEEIDISKDLFD